MIQLKLNFYCTKIFLRSISGTGFPRFWKFSLAKARNTERKCIRDHKNSLLSSCVTASDYRIPSSSNSHDIIAKYDSVDTL